MNPASGTVYGTGSLVDSTDPQYTSLPASVGVDALQHLTYNHVPGHLIPGAPFLAYNGSSRAEALEILEGDSWNSYDIHLSFMHQDLTTDGARHIQTYEPHSAVQAPLMTSGFNMDLTTEGVMPYSDCSALFAVPDHSCMRQLDPTVEPLNLNDCDSLMQEYGISWDVSNTFEVGVHTQNIPHRPLNLKSNDSTHRCEWAVNGTPCNEYYPEGDSLKHSVSRHMNEAHSIFPADGKSTQRCLWMGCIKELKLESIVRHILTVHLHITTKCKGCGTSFARQDSLQRHMKNSCGARNAER